MLTSLNAQEISDNLLNNNTFDDNTNGWTLSDSNVKRDSNSYADAGNSPTVRFKGQTSTISQLVDLTAVEQGKEIQSYTIKYNGYGCGNSPGGWCLDEADDTIVTNITFTDGTTTEVSSHTIAVPYEDGWTHHVFTKSINDSFITGNVAINFELSGIDTGDSNSWLGPITDNYEFMITYDDFVAPVVEPIVEPIVEEVIEAAVIETVVEETMIGGLDLSTEVTLDLIQDVPTLPSIGGTISELPAIPDIEPIEIDMPELMDVPIEIDMPPAIPEIQVEMPVDIPEIADVQPIQEIKEIEVQQPEMAGAENDQRSIEPEAEGQIEVAEAKAETGGELSEPEPDTSTKSEEGSKESSGESKANADKGGEPSDTTEVATADSKEDKGDSRNSKSKSKSKAKDNAKANRPTSTAKKKISKPKATLPINTARPKTIAQLPLPIAYLQNITESITLIETISLQQEMIYGGQQVDNLNTSSITIIALDNNTSSRWSNLQNERKRFKAPKYRK